VPTPWGALAAVLGEVGAAAARLGIEPDYFRVELAPSYEEIRRFREGFGHSAD
jgi:hypothetical protein